jgi:hypothetical protein
MTKLLADRLLAMPQSNDVVTEQARVALKLPDHNIVESDAAGACDRFVLSRSFDKAVDVNSANARNDLESHFAQFSNVRAPLPVCWIESLPDVSIPDHQGVGWFVKDETITAFLSTIPARSRWGILLLADKGSTPGRGQQNPCPRTSTQCRQVHVY